MPSFNLFGLDEPPTFGEAVRVFFGALGGNADTVRTAVPGRFHLETAVPKPVAGGGYTDREGNQHVFIDGIDVVIFNLTPIRQPPTVGPVPPGMDVLNQPVGRADP